ncbi:helix-turn-helix domain-containing protein [Puniceicoccus vermicola]|uniref:Helix-turn-helix domain-containing protein n=1 Tax=Puniceicoccus vermicola TaxID=388746 RepID=A0A7X1B0C9_9BACT|nr:helix-turn-helix domain-containing protein [Puniceicoccus vermicola]MBC2603144.1 helix-turn-helix domain-containing protein [Puniceicoccus vermicola]
MAEDKVVERRREIVDRIIAGETQVSIAKEIGVTRQAINQIYRSFQEEGEAYFERPGRGRQREVDLLSPDEKQQMVDWVLANPPSAIGAKEKRWTLRLVKRAIVHQLDKRVRLPVAHGVFHAAFPERVTVLPSEKGMRRRPRKPKTESSSTTPTQSPSQTAPRPRVTSSRETEDGFPSIEEMAEMNRATLEARKGKPTAKAKRKK